MAGGMNKRGDWGSMADRIAATDRSVERAEKFGHGSPEHLRRPPGGSNVTPQAKFPARHCWLVTSFGRTPALLLDWRQDDAGEWEGLVVRQIPAGFTVTWVRAVMLKPTTEPPSPA